MADIEPFVESTSDLPIVHSDNEVTHNAMSLRLHLRNEMPLFTLILLDLDTEMVNLLFMMLLTLIKNSDVIHEDLLSGLRAQVFPD